MKVSCKIRFHIQESLFEFATRNGRPLSIDFKDRQRIALRSLKKLDNLGVLHSEIQFWMKSHGLLINMGKRLQSRCAVAFRRLLGRSPQVP